MLATAVASSADCSSGCDSELASLTSLSALASSPSCPLSSQPTQPSSRATPMSDTDLTNLGWLQKPGVLTSMCTALTDHSTQPNGGKATGVRSSRKPRQPKSNGEGSKMDPFKSRSHPRSSDKMVNVILNVRNRKYNGEDASKPPLSFACMIFMAVESSPTKTLPVKGIYDWVMWKFPYYRDAPPGWKNSVRHNLSLNKCFKKVDRYSGKSANAVCKGGLWTVDPDYRRSLLAALKRSPYHPYHSYFSPPLSPSSSSSSLDDVDPAERDAALTMCMIGGNSEGAELLGCDLLHGVYHDHCYTKDPPRPHPVWLTPPTTQQVTVKLANRTNKKPSGLTLDEIVAAAEMILAPDDSEGADEVGVGSDQSSDEGIGGEVETDMDEEEEGEGSVGGDSSGMEGLGDSGYAGSTSPPNRLQLISSLDEMGADALLCLATSASRADSSSSTNIAAC